MLAQVLHRDTVLDHLETVKKQLTQTVTTRAEPSAPAAVELTPEDYAEALARLEQAEKAERAASSGQPSFPPQPTGRRSAPPAPLDDFSFFSRDPIISNLQSALDEYWQSRAVEEPQPDDRRKPSGRRGGRDEEVAVTTQSLPGVSARRAAGRRLFDKFSITDPGWVSSVFAMGIRKLRDKKKFNDQPPAPIRLAERARLVMVGDWGSGLPRAQKVAAEMRRSVQQGLDEGREVHVLHLGDVYYSGWASEYQKRFLPYWPVRPEESDRVGSWCLNGNHDMYSGGHGFYDTLLADPRFARQARCSYFSLFNDSWRIVGLDTAWEDGGLEAPQAKWLHDAAQGDTRQLLLLSHHQPFSAYEQAGTIIPDRLSNVLASNRVKAWFWGHEHRCMLFDSFNGVQFGRCIGHGGVPVYMSHKENDPYPKPGNYEYRSFIDKGLEKWALFGHAVADIDGPSVSVTYVDENGFAHKTEKFQA